MCFVTTLNPYVFTYIVHIISMIDTHNNKFITTIQYQVKCKLSHKYFYPNPSEMAEH